MPLLVLPVLRAEPPVGPPIEVICAPARWFRHTATARAPTPSTMSFGMRQLISHLIRVRRICVRRHSCTPRFHHATLGSPWCHLAAARTSARSNPVLL